MVETNIEIKLEEEFPIGISVVKESENDVPKFESSSTCGKDKYKYDKEINDVTGNKEQENTLITVYKAITF